MESLVAMFAAMLKPMLLCLLGLAAFVGALGAASPRALSLTVAAGNHWVDTWRYFHVSENSLMRRFDKWIEVDGFALRHSRAVGIALVAAAALLGYCLLAW